MRRGYLGQLFQPQMFTTSYPREIPFADFLGLRSGFPESKWLIDSNGGQAEKEAAGPILESIVVVSFGFNLKVNERGGAVTTEGFLFFIVLLHCRQRGYYDSSLDDRFPGGVQLNSVLARFGKL